MRGLTWMSRYHGWMKWCFMVAGFWDTDLDLRRQSGMSG